MLQFRSGSTGSEPGFVCLEQARQQPRVLAAEYYTRSQVARMDSEKDEECSRSSLLRDDEAARRLELAALNHVALGEWEAARANLTVLASRYPGERKRVKEILISLVLKAREHW